MTRMTALLLAASALCAPLALRAETLPPSHEPTPAPLADLVRAVDIPYQRFTLKNGLAVLVHTDRKAPIVGVTTYYRVGSKNEPRGHTGFAHLYEHLFFGGSENVANFDAPLEAAGASKVNGSTWYDRTNYVQTVPTGALPLALFIESDRMGHLLGAVSQDKLDKQRGVVENEKRQNDNQPYGLSQYAVGEGLFPIGHPYRHATIGSMSDLNAASLADVHQWFREHYAPNNAILVLSGDIDVDTARPLVEKYFGDIPSGPKVTPVVAGPVTLAQPIHREMTDQVATLRLMRAWSTPGLNDPDAPALTIAMKVLGGLAYSRLDNALVRGQQLAVDNSAMVEQHEQVGIASVSIDVRPGVARATAEAALDAQIAQFLRDGPTPDELRRATPSAVREQIGALEQVGGFGGKGSTLAEGLVYSDDPAHYRKEMAEIAALTPERVRDVARHWLGRPALMIAVAPGARTASGDAMGGWGDDASRPAAPADSKTPVPPIAQSAGRETPGITPVGTLTFPKLEHARLANGIAVTLARRDAVPKVMVNVSFEAGVAADAVDTPGMQGFMLAMLTEGTTEHTASALLAAEERLGATIGASAGSDTSAVTLDALAPNLTPSLALLREVIRSPRFAPDDVGRLRQQRLATLEQVQDTPADLAKRVFAPAIYGAGHPYGQPSDGLGDAAHIGAVTPEALRAAQARWLRPDLAHITVIGDIDMAHLLPLLEANFGDWHAPAIQRPTRSLDHAVPDPRPRIILLDRPGAGQSAIVAGRVLPLSGWSEGRTALSVANDTLGGDILSRLNSDLREDKGWTYGISSAVHAAPGRWSFMVATEVETPHTGDSIRHILDDLAAFPGAKPVTRDEMLRGTEGVIRALPAEFETNTQVLDAIEANAMLGRPEDYYATLPAQARAVDAGQVDAAAKAYLKPDGLVFVVVGDAKVVLPQLQGLGLPVERVPTPGNPTGG